MPKILMKTTQRGQDGRKDVKTYFAGESYTMGDDLATVFVSNGWGTMDTGTLMPEKTPSKIETDVDETDVDETDVDETDVDETDVDETDVDEAGFKLNKEYIESLTLAGLKEFAEKAELDVDLSQNKAPLQESVLEALGIE